METHKLFSSFKLGDIVLKNRIVMAPMTRSRAVDQNVPNLLMAEYYGQRTSAGLIITEGTSPSPNGIGYARIPGIYNQEQVEGWKLVTKAVHEKGSRIFIQLMHTGRVSHPLNMPNSAIIVAPSAIKAPGQMYTDKEGMKDHPEPKEMSLEDIIKAKQEHITAAKNAIVAGFDGIELHGANGYLLEQFLNPGSNTRTDQYGGSIENRTRFILEIAKEAAAAIGKDKIGIRLSPFGANGGMSAYAETQDTYLYLAKELSKIGIAYIHIVDHSSMGAPQVPDSIKDLVRKEFKGTYILSGGYTIETAERDLEANKGDLVAFGRPFISNPDLADRFKNHLQLNNDLKGDLLYTPGPVGYTDYPFAS